VETHWFKLVVLALGTYLAIYASNIGRFKYVGGNGVFVFDSRTGTIYRGEGAICFPERRIVRYDLRKENNL
jgi:hypothetical protein